MLRRDVCDAADNAGQEASVGNPMRLIADPLAAGNRGNGAVAEGDPRAPQSVATTRVVGSGAFLHPPQPADHAIHPIPAAIRRN